MVGHLDSRKIKPRSEGEREDGPAGAGAVDLVCLGVAPHPAHVAPARRGEHRISGKVRFSIQDANLNDFLVGENVLEVLDGAVQRLLLDGLGGLPGVLVADPKVGALGFRALGGVVGLPRAGGGVSSSPCSLSSSWSQP